MSKRSLAAMGATILMALAAPSTASATVDDSGGFENIVTGLSIGVSMTAGIAFIGTVADMSDGDGAHPGWTVPAIVLGTGATVAGAALFSAAGGFDGKFDSLARASFISVGVGVSSIAVGIIGAALYGTEAGAGAPGDLALAPVATSESGDVLPGLSAFGSF